MPRESPLEEPAALYSRFSPEDAKRLRTYTEDVDALVSLSFFHGPRLSVTIAEPGIGDTLEGPSDEATRSYTQMLWMRVRRKAAYLPGC